MRNVIRFCLYAICVASVALVGRGLAADKADIFADAKLISQGVNMGNALDAPREGEWGMTLEEKYFEETAKAGFNSVRIPIRWSTHAQVQPPYTIDPEFFKRVDWAIDQALSRKLAAIINIHHYEEMDRDPDKELPRLVGLWKQIATRYGDRSDHLFFELFNEPHDKFTPEKWNEALAKLLPVIRESNPRRPVIVGPGMWNGLHFLEKLKLPADERLIVTFHYYEPFQFTHQGAEWAEGSQKWKGTTWTGTDEQLAALRKDFDKAAEWGKAHHRPLFLGEFGAYQAADMPSRATWTQAIVREAESRGIGWCYWEFGSGFGAFDREAGKWREPLKKALVGAAR